jgi:hypothetical protein
VAVAGGNRFVLVELQTGKQAGSDPRRRAAAVVRAVVVMVAGRVSRRGRRNRGGGGGALTCPSDPEVVVLSFDGSEGSYSMHTSIAWQTNEWR